MSWPGAVVDFVIASRLRVRSTEAAVGEKVGYNTVTYTTHNDGSAIDYKWGIGLGGLGG